MSAVLLRCANSALYAVGPPVQTVGTALNGTYGTLTLTRVTT